MEDFLLRVAWSAKPDHLIRRGEVSADMGLELPDPPPTREEMEHVMLAAKGAMLKCIRARKRTRK